MISRTNACFDFSVLATSEIHDARDIFHQLSIVTTGVAQDFIIMLPFSILEINGDAVF
jgi:hypothetical protein